MMLSAGSSECKAFAAEAEIKPKPHTRANTHPLARLSDARKAFALPGFSNVD
jgi:hypothetical protein